MSGGISRVNKLRGPIPIALACAVGAVFLIWVVLPYYFLFLVSLSSSGASIAGFHSTAALTFDNFKVVITGNNSIWPYLMNTVIVAGGGTILTMFLALPAGYGLSRLQHVKSARVVYLSMLVLRMVPPITLIIPFYLAFNHLGLLDTKIGLVLATTPLLLPFAIWTIRAFFDGIPVSLEEAARLDGCSLLGVIIRIIVPVTAQGIIATSVLVLLQAYVEYMFAVTLSKSEAITLPVYLTSFQNESFVYVGYMMAATLISIIPMIVLYSYAHKYMTRVSTGGIH
jgi:multiple sugar transport system permease protein